MNCIKTYEQTTDKIAYTTEAEFIEQFNKLEVSADFTYSIKPTTPNCTDTRQWVEIHYYKQI